MTNREKLIALLSEVQYLGGLEEKVADHLIANGVVISKNETTTQRWIPVTERLPKPFISVLVYMPGERPLPTVHEGYVASDGNWYAHYFVRDTEEVTHWMPLPSTEGIE